MFHGIDCFLEDIQEMRWYSIRAFPQEQESTYDWISQKEALSTYSIKEDTLYRMVKRGYVRTVSVPCSTTRLYNKKDLQLYRELVSARVLARNERINAAKKNKDINSQVIT